MLISGIFVAIVSFCEHRDLICSVVRSGFPSIHEQIVTRDTSSHKSLWVYQGCQSKNEGKHQYMASAAEELYRKHSCYINRGSSLLIDDDPSNVRVALQNGVRSVLFCKDSPER